jgi:hypothetical protein
MPFFFSPPLQLHLHGIYSGIMLPFHGWAVEPRSVLLGWFITYSTEYTVGSQSSSN